MKQETKTRIKKALLGKRADQPLSAHLYFALMIGIIVMTVVVTVIVGASFDQTRAITYPKKTFDEFYIVFSLTNQTGFNEVTVDVNVTSFENVGIGFVAFQLLNFNITAYPSFGPFAAKIQAMYFTFQDMILSNRAPTPDVNLPPVFIQLEPNSTSHLVWKAYSQGDNFAFGGNYEPILYIWYGSDFNTTQMHQVFTNQYLQIEPISTAQTYVYALNNEYLTIALTVFAIFEAGVILIEIYPKAFPKPTVEKQNTTQNNDNQPNLESLINEIPANPKLEDSEVQNQSVETQDK